MIQDVNQLLSELLTRLSTAGDSISFCFDEIAEWPSGFLPVLEQSGLVTQDVDAQSLICTGCENGCSMPVVFTEDALRAFIVCDHPEQQNHMGRITVKLQRLSQWQLNTRQVASVVVKSLGLDESPSYQSKTGSYSLGMLKSDKGRRSVVLSSSPLSININQHAIPVSELFYIEANRLELDLLRIDDVLHAKSLGKGKIYKANSDKQQTRKLLTQAMYADWQDEYKKLKSKNPKKTDTWISCQIAKMPIGKDKSSETIRKNMKD